MENNIIPKFLETALTPVGKEISRISIRTEDKRAIISAWFL